MAKVITIRLETDEINWCDQASHGNRSYYIRGLIRRDKGSTNTNVYVPVVTERTVEARQVNESSTEVARSTIMDMFNL